jgi:glucan phosphoethanolaminetransferase (alkaline phosphatase superfamily)
MRCVSLTPKQELMLWVIAGSAGIAAFFLTDSFNVSASTYRHGSLLLVLTAFLFGLRFRYRPARAPEWLRMTSNSILVLLIILLLYLLGVATNDK